MAELKSCYDIKNTLETYIKVINGIIQFRTKGSFQKRLRELFANVRVNPVIAEDCPICNLRGQTELNFRSVSNSVCGNDRRCFSKKKYQGWKDERFDGQIMQFSIKIKVEVEKLASNILASYCDSYPTLQNAQCWNIEQWILRDYASCVYTRPEIAERDHDEQGLLMGEGGHKRVSSGERFFYLVKWSHDLDVQAGFVESWWRKMSR